MVQLLSLCPSVFLTVYSVTVSLIIVTVFLILNSLGHGEEAPHGIG